MLQKFTREIIGSPNVDNCARICHSPSLKGLKTTIGEGAASNSFDDIYRSEFILVIGSNTTEAHPIVANRLLEAKKSNQIELATIDVREIQLSKNSNYHLSIPYEANLLILNMIAYIIISEDLVDKEFIKNRTKWYEKYRESILNDKYANPEFIKTILEYEHLYDDLFKIARNYATKKSMILWGLGVTEHNDGSYAVMAISHLALLTGNIGKEGAGLMPLRGQNNVQGTCDMGMLPYFNPDYQPPKEIGLMTPDLIDAMLDDKIKALFVMGEDIAHIHPNLNKVHKALKKLDCIIVNEIFQNEITKFADIIFGVKSAYEKVGVYINAERRAHLSTPIIESNMPDDWEVIQNIENRINNSFEYKNSEDIWNEVRSVASNRYSGAEYKKLKNSHLDALQWPIKDNGTKILHQKEFRTDDGIAIFEYHQYELRGQIKELIEKREYQNFYLTTGRILAHYNNVAQTKNCDRLIKSHSEDILLYSSEDRELFKNREYIKLKSIYGESNLLKTKESKTIKKGTLYTTFHHPKSGVNFLFGDEHDILVKTANFKSVKVEIVE
jgi:formate dehydrogenase major subunit